jgi:ArsR family transcriptional regulator
MNIIEVLKALAHENRIRILNLLAENELCVCELENILQVNQSNASRHLSKLKNADLIKAFEKTYHQKAPWLTQRTSES